MVAWLVDSKAVLKGWWVLQKVVVMDTWLVGVSDKKMDDSRVALMDGRWVGEMAEYSVD